MTRKKRPLVPEARPQLNKLEESVLSAKGYQSEDAKYELASDLNVPLQKGYNGNLKSKDAGKLGGEIGGNMVKEMIKSAQQQLLKKNGE